MVKPFGIFIVIAMTSATMFAQDAKYTVTEPPDDGKPSVTFVLAEALQMTRSTPDKQPSAKFQFTGSACRGIFWSWGSHKLRCACEVYFTTPIANQNLTITANTQWNLTGIVPAIGMDHAKGRREGLELVQSTNPNNRMVLQCYSNIDQGTYHNLQWQPAYSSYSARPEDILNLVSLDEDKSRISSKTIFNIQKTNPPSDWNYFRGENQDFYIPGVIN